MRGVRGDLICEGEGGERARRAKSSIERTTPKRSQRVLREGTRGSHPQIGKDEKRNNRKRRKNWEEGGMVCVWC